jgi:hypothetical protein
VEDPGEIVEIQWQGIAVTIHVARNWLNTGFHHIEVQADQSLPITNTGYRSHFMPPAELDQWDTVEAFVTDWLDDAALAKQWVDYLVAKRQLRLF